MRGFTLVELLVATVCLAVTAIGILTAIAFTENQNSLARQRGIALSIASSEIETYRSKAYSDGIVAGVYTADLATSGLGKPCTRTTTVTKTSDPKLFTVSVNVHWTGFLTSGPQDRSIHLDTVLRNNDAP